MNTPILCLARSVAILMLISLMGAGISGAATIHVPGDFARIQDAIDAAQYGDEVVLAPGTYKDSVSRALFLWNAQSVAFLKNGVSVRGSAGAHVTFVDGEGARHCLVGENLDTSTVVEGITLINGRAAGSDGNAKWGGGALFYHSAVQLRGNRFVDCTAGGIGTGGGGLFIYAGDGVEIASNLFLRCSAGQLGGGIEIYNSPLVNVLNNTFVENDGGDAGGGLLMNGMTGHVSNNIFYRNRATIHDGGHGCIGIGNDGVTGSCNLYWENTVGPIALRNDCGFGPGVGGSFEADPLFCDPDLGDYTLQSDSPAAPQNSPGCGLIGAHGVACGPVTVEPRSWGAIKGHYRQDRR